MNDEYTYHLTFDEDGSDPVVIRFAPDEETERVIFAQPRYAVWDESSCEHVEWFNDRDGAEEHAGDLNDQVGSGSDDPQYWVQDAYENDSRPDWFHEGGFGAVWKSTDAWRGYTDPVYDDSIWEPYISGWVTGYPDEYTSYKMTAADLHNGLYDGSLIPPFPIVWFFGVTSNVFSQVSDILIPVGKADEFEAWLGTVNFDPEAVQHAFN